VSHNYAHYQWFVDRVFVFQIISSQLAEVRDEISKLNLPQQNREHLLGLLANLQGNIVIHSEMVGGDKITTGDITESGGVAIGREARTKVEGREESLHSGTRSQGTVGQSSQSGE
jgi:hypothetical protein